MAFCTAVDKSPRSQNVAPCRYDARNPKFRLGRGITQAAARNLVSCECLGRPWTKGQLKPSQLPRLKALLEFVKEIVELRLRVRSRMLTMTSSKSWAAACHN